MTNINTLTTEHSYTEGLLAHLTRYRADVLGIAEAGTWNGKPYGHILPRGRRLLNLLPPFGDEIEQYTRTTGIKLHQLFHHLNSSQAFAFALFYPFFKHAPEALASALRVAGPISDGEFERVYDPAEGTNVDVTWASPEGRVLCEVKLTERGFGTCRNDEKHLAKLESIYKPLLGPFVLDRELLEPKTFFRSYQLLRNLALLVRRGCEQDRLVFLLPEGNRQPNEQLTQLSERISPELWGRVQVRHVEPLISGLRTAKVPPRLEGYADALAAKYLPV